MRIVILKVFVILIALLFVIFITNVTGPGGGVGFLWPIVSLAFVGFFIAVIKWKPNKDRDKDNSDNDKFILKKD